MTQARRVRLVLRRIEPWTVLKFSLLLYASLYLVLLVAAITLWAAASITGLRGSVESFVGDLVASKDFHFKGGELLRASILGGTLLVLVGSGVTVLLSVLHNLISDLIGGFGVVFEERPLRSTTAGSSSAEARPPRKSWSEDDSEPEVIEPRRPAAKAKPDPKPKPQPTKRESSPARPPRQPHPSRRHPSLYRPPPHPPPLAPSRPGPRRPWPPPPASAPPPRPRLRPRPPPHRPSPRPQPRPPRRRPRQEGRSHYHLRRLRPRVIRRVPRPLHPKPPGRIRRSTRPRPNPCPAPPRSRSRRRSTTARGTPPSSCRLGPTPPPPPPMPPPAPTFPATAPPPPRPRARHPMATPRPFRRVGRPPFPRAHPDLCAGPAGAAGSRSPRGQPDLACPSPAVESMDEEKDAHQRPRPAAVGDRRSPPSTSMLGL